MYEKIVKCIKGLKPTFLNSDTNETTSYKMGLNDGLLFAIQVIDNAELSEKLERDKDQYAVPTPSTVTGALR